MTETAPARSYPSATDTVLIGFQDPTQVTRVAMRRADLTAVIPVEVMLDETTTGYFLAGYSRNGSMIYLAEYGSAADRDAAFAEAAAAFLG